MDKPLLFKREDTSLLVQKDFHYLVVCVCKQSDKNFRCIAMANFKRHMHT